jgi:hypothetical protein
MMDHALIRQWWNSIQSIEKNVLEDNASSLCNLHNSEQILDIQPLTGLQFPVIRSNDLISRRPEFKRLASSDLLFLRKCILTEENTTELTSWAEFLLRYLEINRSSIIKKARLQFGSTQSGRIALLELTAFLLDIYFEWDDLRYLNLALKIMDMPGIFSLGSVSKKLINQKKKLPLLLIQVRLMILRQAALDRINKN